MKTVPERLAALGDIYKERNLIYKDNYKHYGKVLLAIFPNGINLQTEEEFNRFALLLHIIDKMTRYANSFHQGGHQDSLDDVSIYAQMLREYDDEGSGV